MKKATIGAGAAMVFAIAVVDVASAFVWVPLPVVVASGGLSLLGIFVLALGRQGRRPSWLWAPLLASLLVLAFRGIWVERVAHRSGARWSSLQRELAEELAHTVTSRFTLLGARAQQTAQQLAESPSVIAAAKDGTSVELRQRAFETLRHAVLPRSLPEVPSGATLHDPDGLPVAWSGENVELPPSVSSVADVDESPFVLEKGVFTYLVAREALPEGHGAVTVEIPLAARRQLNNRYLTDFDAVTSWAGKSVLTEYIDVREDEAELRELFAGREDRFWGGSTEAPALYFPLRTPGGELVGVATIPVEDPATALLEGRRRAQRGAALALALGALAIVLSLGARAWRTRTTRDAVGFVGGLWVLRLVVFWTDLPLGFGLDIDDPGLYASDIFFGLFRSPADLFLTSVSLALTVAVFVWIVLRPYAHDFRPGLHRKRGVPGALAGGILSLVIALLTCLVLRDTWVNSNLALSLPGFFAPAAPRFAVQLGWVCLLLSSAALAVALHVVLAGRWRDEGPAFRACLVRFGAIDVGIVAAAYVLLARTSLAPVVVASILPVLAYRLLACAGPSLRARLEGRDAYARLVALLAGVLVPVGAYYPAIAYFEGRSIHHFVESTVAPSVIHHGNSQRYVLQQTLDAIDRMELAGRLSSPEQSDLAYRIWSESDLSVFAASSSIEVQTAAGSVVSRFSLEFPEAELVRHEPAGLAAEEWVIEEESYAGEPHRPRVLHAHRILESEDGAPYGIHVRLVTDWTSLVFITTRNPYIDLFRATAAPAPLPFPHRDLSLFVFDLDGHPLYRSIEPSLAIDDRVLARSREAPVWMERSVDGGNRHLFVFSGPQQSFVLSYPGKTPLDLAAEMTAWLLLATAIAVVFFIGSVLSRGFRPGDSFSFPSLWSELGTRFYGKLLVAFTCLALIPIVLLSFFLSGVVAGQLEKEVEQEGISRARVVERFVHDYLLYQRLEENEQIVDVTDSILEWVASLVGAEVDLYRQGDLVATSKRELFSSGLLPERAPPAVYRRLALERANDSVHRQSVGAFQYLVVSVPIMLEASSEPGILSLPLASRQREIGQQLASLNQTVLLAAFGFALAAAVLAYALAHRIAEPIKSLTAATRRVAQGDLEVSLESRAQDEIGALFASFNQMTSDLKRQREHLERTKKFEAWAEMARQVAHEIKNPLTPIQLAAEHMRRVFGDARVSFDKVLNDCTETILKQVRTLRQISMEFSTFASPYPIDRQAMDLGRLVLETLRPYRTTPPPGVSITVEVAEDLPLVEVDRRLIQRTIVNLLENALHALEGEGQVTVSVLPVASRAKRLVELTVSDTGRGIEAAVRDRIFEPYFSTRVAGTGLGLAIARKAVEEHGGSIELESELGKGTRVRLRLPVQDTRVSEEEAPAQVGS